MIPLIPCRQRHMNSKAICIIYLYGTSVFSYRQYATPRFHGSPLSDPPRLAPPASKLPYGEASPSRSDLDLKLVASRTLWGYLIQTVRINVRCCARCSTIDSNPRHACVELSIADSCDCGMKLYIYSRYMYTSMCNAAGMQC